MRLERASGILLHPTSLPNGVLDAYAYRFVDWLATAGQRWWQVLPLGPPDSTGSPYASPSAFAGSPTLLAKPKARVGPTERGEFRARNAYWIDDWVDFGGSMDDQVRFDREWRALRTYAAECGVRVFGDMPMYVAPDGADHRAHPELFRRGAVAGVPPDAFARTGQLWGNPIYDWPALRRRRYCWWVERFRRTLALVDLTRIDHFRGFVAYWAVPARHATAAHGRWLRGPGASVFRAAEAALGPLPVVAEDLGVITPPVERLRRELGFPGMVVLQFTGGRVPPDAERQSVVYTGTHDNETTRAWLERHPEADSSSAWTLIERAWRSKLALAVAPLQDVLELGDDARMNLPGTAVGNWSWHYEPSALSAQLAAKLRKVTNLVRRS
jgi:4-alpha-glucanotransferase